METKKLSSSEAEKINKLTNDIVRSIACCVKEFCIIEKIETNHLDILINVMARVTAVNLSIICDMTDTPYLNLFPSFINLVEGIMEEIK